MSEIKRIEVTHKNAILLSTGFLNTLVEQNKIIIQLLQAMNGSISKIAALDIGDDNGKPNDGK